MINILKSPIQEYTHILHVADIHIRLNKRHDEYKEIFNKLYSCVENTPSTTVVAILGDVFHSKSDLSPECVQMASDFFVSLANLRPTILIAGNHDATLSNKNRLDSLTPIVDALNHSNFFYFKDTGLYGFGNILFNTMGVFDTPDKYIRGETIPSIYRNQYEHVVALFHGPVDGAATDTGFRISNPRIMSPLFDYHDIALLGDIHKKQDIQYYDAEENKPCIHYPGSLIQQNHGESLHNHGYSLWNLKERSYEFVELSNDYGFFTIEIHKGQLVTSLDELPKRARLRVKCYESIASEIKTVISNIKSKVDIAEISYIRMEQEEKKDLIPICKDIVLQDLTNVAYQEKLISEFLEKKLNIKEKSRINDIIAINLSTNNLIKKDDFIRNLRWTPIRFEFDNMFTYGEGNVIDFTKMDGIYGIFGPNRSGKSSILSAITFCLFDKFDRGFKGLFVRNARKSTFRCKLEFEIEGIRYFIERNGETTRSGNVKVSVQFWRIKDGKEEELHGNARRDTNELIRDYVGTYEDFVLTTLSVQSAKNNISFIDMGNTERKDLLVQFIGLSVFDRLYESASERNKELASLLKIHKDKNYAFEKNQNETLLSQSKLLLDDENVKVASLQKQISDVNDQIVLETSNLIKLDATVPTNLEAIQAKKSLTESNISTKKKSIDTLSTSISDIEKNLTIVNSEILTIEASDLVESHKKYKAYISTYNSINQKIELKKVEVRGKFDKVNRLKTHEYDPNCKYCTNNSFVKDAVQAKEELAKDKIQVDQWLSELNVAKAQSDQYKWVEDSYEKYTKLLNSKSKLQTELSEKNQSLIIAKNELVNLETSLASVITQIELYNRNEISVKHNEKINFIIKSYKDSLNKLDIELKSHNKILMDLSGKVATYTNKIEELSKTLEDIRKLEYEFDLYKDYMQAVGRDGISYQVICNTVPEIEREVNTILNQIVDYTIQLETDGKNVIPYIVYDQCKWPIEMSSGFERFVASIAIRIALSNISNLPKCSMLLIDEGFGTLDAEHLPLMASLFSYLKSNFDFIMVVSHVDALKDAVDKQIEIKQDGYFSKVIFE